jgi:hypothetical protein
MGRPLHDTAHLTTAIPRKEDHRIVAAKMHKRRKKEEKLDRRWTQIYSDLGLGFHHGAERLETFLR